MTVADLHTHTSLCNHAEGAPESYLDAALARGLRWYGISDHTPWSGGFDPKYRMKQEEFPLYRDLVRKMRKRAEGTPLKVLYAIEMDYIEGKRDPIRSIHENEPFDYIIGSIHQTELFPFDDPDLIDEWKKPGVPEHIWDVYLKYLKDFVSNWDFQILGHCDLPKKFGYHPVENEDFIKKMTEVFEIAAERGIAVELNANGLHVPAKEIYPSPALLRLAKKAGVDITYGSDAHSPNAVGRDIDEVRTLARECGFRQFVTFEQKKKIPIPI